LYSFIEINMSNTKIMVLGAAGQIGSDLVSSLRQKYGNNNVVATDLAENCPPALVDGPYESLDALNADALLAVIKKYEINHVYHLVAMLSATAEKHPMKGWDLNMRSLFNLLEIAKDKHIQRIFWPSSIAVFGPNSPKTNTPQRTVLEPTTVYGISKVAGESWCEYYHQKYGVDVRCLRYPGLISYKSAPGGGTTDYAIHIFHEALKHKHYTSFIEANIELPMMYMPDAIRATIGIMEAPSEKIKLRTGYNLAAISFTPAQIAEEIKNHIPEFTIDYTPDFRNAIAASWPGSIDDQEARADWGWQHEFSLPKMVGEMLHNLKKKVLVT
jgi:nucleoside-diphosphate-sugar epimerase